MCKMLYGLLMSKKSFNPSDECLVIKKTFPNIRNYTNKVLFLKLNRILLCEKKLKLDKILS